MKEKVTKNKRLDNLKLYKLLVILIYIYICVCVCVCVCVCFLFCLTPEMKCKKIILKLI